MNEHHFFSRREFLGGSLAAGASATLVNAFAADAPAGDAKPKEFARKIKLGLIGCGGRGSWLGDLFSKHGGYKIH
ncbi:MAG: twin-arginine translocation signal domain-containing protein, partial [Verrucomicrobia bacterium]|nr:twin-arginine translocation signal domain-containing protein [Verrucomicrobiota bacterium]